MIEVFDFLIISVFSLSLILLIVFIKNAYDVKKIADNKTMTSREKIDKLREQGYC